MANHQLLNCEQCPIHDSTLQKLGLNNDSWDFVVALAGNPNTGKSTIFNALTGLRQHTGNWPGKTVTRMEGAFSYENKRYKIVDLPGTYSLLSTSTDEEIARNFILFGKPDVTVIVVDATRLERNLNLVLQILEITNRAVICLNLMDEAKRHQLEIDSRRLSKELGVPVVPTVARQNLGIQQLLRAIHEVASGQYQCRPHRLRSGSRELKTALRELVEKIETHFPGLNNARWVALRLLEGDPYITEALRTGELAGIYQTDSQFESNNNNKNDSAVDEIIHQANNLRWEIGDDLHDSFVEAIYQDAAQIADRVVRKSDESPRFDWERRLDNLLTNKWTGFPIMLLILAVVFWLTIVGANFPSSLLANLLIDTIHPSLKTLAANIHMPAWLSGLLFDGMYLSMAWVVSVMLPPMAIFFPLFTLLEDFGYLPRVAFNLDHIFKRVGAHGKQALTMAMGYGCNAAG
ncbi:MAG: ferrous iron transporter B, partial [Calditrichaeota bacterium]